MGNGITKHRLVNLGDRKFQKRALRCFFEQLLGSKPRFPISGQPCEIDSISKHPAILEFVYRQNGLEITDMIPTFAGFVWLKVRELTMHVRA